MEEPTPHQCPHLGILDDPSTSHSFPSSWNACFYANTPSVPSFEHQEKTCLTGAYITCPVYQAGKGTPFPPALLNTVKPSKPPQERNLVPFYILGAVLLLVVGAGLTLFLGPTLLASARLAPPALTQSETNAPVAHTPVPTATYTPEPPIIPIPSLELTATVTSTPSTTAFKPFPIDIPFKIGEEDLLIHRIKDGDGIDILAKTYHTTPEIIRAANYQLKMPILADNLMIIRPDVIILDPNQQAFEIYLVEDKTILLDDLAKRLTVDLTKIKYYNNCTGRCLLSRGDWVLVPRHQ